MGAEPVWPMNYEPPWRNRLKHGQSSSRRARHRGRSAGDQRSALGRARSSDFIWGPCLLGGFVERTRLEPCSPELVHDAAAHPELRPATASTRTMRPGGSPTTASCAPDDERKPHPMAPHGGMSGGVRPRFLVSMSSRPKSCSAASSLWARQRRRIFSAVAGPPLVKGRS